MLKKTTNIILLGLLMVMGCSKDDSEEIDTEYPVIDISAMDSFPKQCGQVKRGETFTYRVSFSDNAELGSTSIDIHHNFDHHTHSTEIEECNLEAKKTPINPFLFIKNYSIPKGVKTYTLEEKITIPADIDPGDYHFMIRLTDKEGWQSIKGLSIKITQ